MSGGTRLILLPVLTPQVEAWCPTDGAEVKARRRSCQDRRRARGIYMDGSVRFSAQRRGVTGMPSYTLESWSLAGNG